MNDPLEPYYSLLGKFTHWWAHLEHGLASMIAVLYHRHDGLRKVHPKIPRAGFDPKLKYLRDALTQQLPVLVDHAARLTDLLDRAEKLSIDRNLFSHGVPTNYDAPKRITAIYKMNFQKKTFLVETIERSVTWEELEAMVHEAVALADISVDVAHRIIFNTA